MVEHSKRAARPYAWTPGRIAVGILIVVAAGTFIGVVAKRELRNIQQGLAADATYADFLAAATREQITEFNLDNLAVAREDIAFGGPRKDGIPALSHPDIVAAADATHLQDDDRVIGVVIGGEARAYPVRALMYHEAVNDDVGGTPIAVVYCPLCDSVSVVERTVNGAVREFGISGLLLNSNVLLFDRIDDSLWSQLGLRAISGPNAGASLTHLPWELTTASAWTAAHPDSTVMTFDTGHDRDYQRSPYPEYFQADLLLFPIARNDGRLSRRTPVVGVELGDTVRAYPTDAIRRAPGGRVRDSIGDAVIVLEADADTGSVRVVEMPPDARAVHTFWFAWAAFHPETEIYEE